MSRALRATKRVTRIITGLEGRLIRFQNMVKAIKKWIKTEKAILNNILKSMSKEEHLQYRYDNGDIERADYLVIKQKMEEK